VVEGGALETEVVGVVEFGGVETIVVDGSVVDNIVLLRVSVFKFVSIVGVVTGIVFVSIVGVVWGGGAMCNVATRLLSDKVEVVTVISHTASIVTAIVVVVRITLATD
jgi:hypothetical protein